MPKAYAPRVFIPTPLILAVFFAIIAAALFVANAWAHDKAAAVFRAEAADTYVPTDETGPVTDAEILPANS